MTFFSVSLTGVLAAAPGGPLTAPGPRLWGNTDGRGAGAGQKTAVRSSSINLKWVTPHSAVPGARRSFRGLPRGRMKLLATFPIGPVCWLRAGRRLAPPGTCEAGTCSCGRRGRPDLAPRPGSPGGRIVSSVSQPRMIVVKCQQRKTLQTMMFISAIN